MTDMIPLEIWFPIAAIGTIEAIKAMIPLGLLAAYALTMEIVLETCDRTFSMCWWIFFAFVILMLGEITWASWTVSTPMADIIRYGEQAGSLIASVFAFVIIVSLILLWLIILGIRKITIEAHGSGWGWALLRLTPLIPLVGFIIHIFLDGNAQVGDSGFIDLINR